MTHRSRSLLDIVHPLRRARRKLWCLTGCMCPVNLTLFGFVTTVMVALMCCCGIDLPSNKHSFTSLPDFASCASCCLALPSALTAFDIHFDDDIIAADFGILGPADVIEAQTNKNAILAVYIRGCRQGTSMLSQSAGYATAAARLRYNATECEDARALEADLVSLESTVADCDPSARWRRPFTKAPCVAPCGQLLGH